MIELRVEWKQCKDDQRRLFLTFFSDFRQNISSKLREEGAGPFICDYRIAEERGFIQEEMRRKHAEDLKEEEKQGPKIMFTLIPS